jgi:hypothetical protein
MPILNAVETYRDSAVGIETPDMTQIINRPCARKALIL